KAAECLFELHCWISIFQLLRLNNYFLTSEEFAAYSIRIGNDVNTTKLRGDDQTMGESRKQPTDAKGQGAKSEGANEASPRRANLFGAVALSPPRSIASLLPRTLLFREEPVRRFHLLAVLRLAPG